MKIIVTGGSGFIGRVVIQKLLGANHSIMALSRSAAEREKEKNTGNIQWINSSLELSHATIQQLEDFAPEVLIHLAWEKIPDFSFETSFGNLQLQLNFFKQVTKIGSLKKIITAGSCFEYNQKFGTCRESDTCMSTNYFTWAKNSLRDFLHFDCLQNNIAFIWARIFYVYGPGQRGGSLIPSVMQNILNNAAPELRKPANANDFIYVDDVADGLKKMAEKEIASGIYNLGSGRSTPVIEIVRTIETQIKNEDIITCKIVENTKDAGKEIDLWADMDKTISNLDWQPAISISEGIQRTIGVYTQRNITHNQ
jgi:UDP-glucose 4-epimerase